MTSRAYTSFLLESHGSPKMGSSVVSMPSRAYTSFLHKAAQYIAPSYMGVNALSGLYLISTFTLTFAVVKKLQVSMPSRAYTSFLPVAIKYSGTVYIKVSMPSRAYTSFLQYTFKHYKYTTHIVCQCPLGLIPHFYPVAAVRDENGEVVVSMPSRAYTSFLRYPFKNLGFMRFSEPVFAGIYQNILTTAVFRAC